MSNYIHYRHNKKLQSIQAPSLEKAIIILGEKFRKKDSLKTINGVYYVYDGLYLEPYGEPQ